MAGFAWRAFRIQLTAAYSFCIVSLVETAGA